LDKNKLITVEVLESSEVGLDGKVRRRFYNARIAKTEEVTDRVRKKFYAKPGQFSSMTNTDLNFLFKELEKKIKEKFEVGDIVTIYEDPLTCSKVEGKARLLELLKDDEQLQYWRVEFLRDHEQANRWIKKERKQQ